MTGKPKPLPNDRRDLDTANGTIQLQNYPLVTSVVHAGGNTTISGSLNSRPGETYRIELFSNPPPTAIGAEANKKRLWSGETFLTSFFVTTDINGNATFPPVSVPGSPSYITSTATDQYGNTSEFGCIFTLFGRQNLVDASLADDSSTGVDINDISQGRLGDCTLLACLGAIAYGDPTTLSTCSRSTATGR